MRMTGAQYHAASAKSFQSAGRELIMPIGDGITEFECGAQFTGVSIWGTTLAVAAYNQPAVCLLECTVEADRLILSEQKIAGVMYRKRFRSISSISWRMFRDVLQPMGANRMQTVVMRSDRELGLIRGTERAIHWIEEKADGRWHFKEREALPESGYELVHSAVLFDDGRLWTIEARNGLEEAALCEYESGIFIRATPMLLWMYGIAVRKKDDAMFTVTDYRFRDSAYGIYIDGVLTVPDVIGNGIALLDGGKKGAVVVRYGESHPSPLYGKPGAIIYVPPHLLTP